MSLSALQWLVSVVVAATVFYTTVTLTLKWEQRRREEGDAGLKSQVDGVGKKARDIEAKAQRRWLHMVYTQIVTAKDLEDAKQIAEQLRQEAYRE